MTTTNLFQLAKRWGGLFQQSRHVVTKSWSFHHPEGSDQVAAKHKTLTADTWDDDETVYQYILNTIKTNPDTLVFLTERSRLLVKTELNHYSHLDLPPNTDLASLSTLIKNKLLHPYAGHVAMTLVDEMGMPVPKHQVSFKPRSPIYLDGRWAMHQWLYGDDRNGFSKASMHTSFDDEIRTVAQAMVRGRLSAVVGDLTFVPLMHMRDKLETILNNIEQIKTWPLYNLCSLIVKKEDIQQITSENIKICIDELAEESRSFQPFQHIPIKEYEIILLAIACTHAISAAIQGDPYAVEKKVKISDQTVQTAVIYNVISLIGTERFLDFAKAIDFYDGPSKLVAGEYGRSRVI